MYRGLRTQRRWLFLFSNSPMKKKNLVRVIAAIGVIGIALSAILPMISF